jgi:DNA-binding YbaB/EbfC family protein
MMGGLQSMTQGIQAEAARAEVEGSAGGGLVVVRMNGIQEVLGVRIDPKVLADAELCEDLVRAAMNEALRLSKEANAAAIRAAMERMGLPAGMFGL